MNKLRINFAQLSRFTSHSIHPPLYSTRPISQSSLNLNGDIHSWNNRTSHLIRTGRIIEAQKVFNEMPQTRTGNKMINGYVKRAEISEARKVIDEMPQRKTRTWNKMINGYVKRGEISMARKVFDEMPEKDKDVVSWNIMISGYVSYPGSAYLEAGRCLFDRMPVRDLVSWNTMITGYARNGRISEALRVFESMPERDVVSWNAIITGFLRNGDVNSAIEWFRKMPKCVGSSLSALVSGLIRNGELDQAKRILLQSSERIVDDDDGKSDLLQAYNTLIAGYGQKGRVDEARHLFDQIPFCIYRRHGEERRFKRNVVSWNAMIMCYVKAGDIVSARVLFDQMVERDNISWNTMINGYVQSSNMDHASVLFSQMPNLDTLSWNTMISGYAQTGNLELALGLFHTMPRKNLVSWNSIIAGFESNGGYKQALELFMQMQTEQEKPDRHTFSSVLRVCAGLVALDVGLLIHQLLTKTLDPDIPVNNALVMMYSRCGAIVEARTVFDEMKSQKDVISWNTMIGGYATYGYATEALELFESMKRLKVHPTEITFISVLNACAHVGLLQEGLRCFNSMVLDFGIEPTTEHFSALVNVMARRGQLIEAMNLINSMPSKPNKVIWGALLSACRIHNDVELARVAAEALKKLEPDGSAPYVMLHNMFADVDQWESAVKVRKTMEINDVKKICASSWLH